MTEEQAKAAEGRRTDFRNGALWQLKRAGIDPSLRDLEVIATGAREAFPISRSVAREICLPDDEGRKTYWRLSGVNLEVLAGSTNRWTLAPIQPMEIRALAELLAQPTAEIAE